MPEINRVFRADAVAIGGYFVRPIPQPLESVSAKVPLVGGIVSQHRGYTRMPFIGFESAYVTAYGTADGEGAVHSYAQAVVEGLNVLEVVTAERCVAIVSSEQRAGEPPSIRIQDARIEGLRVLGRPIDLQFSFPFNEFPTFDDWRRFQSEHDLDKWAIRKEDTQDQLKNRGLTWTHLGATFYQAGDYPSGVKIEENVMRIPDFGSVHIGDVLIARSYRRISMLRFQLGSPVEGQIEAGSSKGGSFAF